MEEKKQTTTIIKKTPEKDLNLKPVVRRVAKPQITKPKQIPRKERLQKNLQFQPEKDLNLKPVVRRITKPQVAKPKPITRKERLQKNLQFQRDKDRTPVKGIFNFHEVPGGELKFRFKKYKGDNVERYCLKDGEVYTIPLGVAKHLNKNCWYPLNQHAVNAEGKSIYKIGEKKRRLSFQSLEFIDPEDFAASDPSIVIAKPV